MEAQIQRWVGFWSRVMVELEPRAERWHQNSGSGGKSRTSAGALFQRRRVRRLSGRVCVRFGHKWTQTECRMLLVHCGGSLPAGMGVA